MGFEGFRGDFVGFFRGLELDNSRSYFEAHRKQYERDVKGPMLALLSDLSADLGPVKLFRINRDTRFSSDKSPYKTSVAGHAGNLYVHLDARQLFVGSGRYHPEAGWLRAFRAAVAAPAGAGLAEIVDRARAHGLSAGGDPLATAPRGYPAGHERIEILRWRNVVLGRGWPVEPWIATPGVKDRVLEAWRYMRPFSDWLAEHVRE